MNSPGHRANILEPRFTKIGVGLYRNSEGRFWVTEMFSAGYGIAALNGVQPRPDFPQPEADGEDDPAADNDLADCLRQRGFHKPIADKSNRQQFNDHDAIRDMERQGQRADQKRQRMQHPAQSRRRSR